MTALPTLADYLSAFTDTLVGHAALAVYLFTIMDERGLRVLKRLPALLFSPALSALMVVSMYEAFQEAALARFCLNSLALLLMCTIWARWAWRTGFWQALSAVSMAGVFQASATALSRFLFRNILLDDEGLQFAAVTAIYAAVTLLLASLLHRLRFGHWFRLLLRESYGPRRTALFFFTLACTMEAFFVLQAGIQPEYFILYYLLVLVMVALAAGLVLYLAHWFDAARRVEVQRDIIAQQQLYERDLESIQREVRAFRHDYKNLLAGLSEQAGKGELDKLRASLSQLDAGFDRHIGEKIQASVHLGNVRVPQVRSLLLSKLAAMGEQGIDCRLEAFYPVEKAGIDPWDFTRCLGILLDNAAEAALETETPWVEIVLLSQKGKLSLRVSNPYAGAIDPDKIWMENFSTKGKGRGLGLPSYQRILADYPNAAASTSWADGVFVQELTVEEKA